MDRDDSLLDALSGLLLYDNNRSTTESSTQTNAPHMESIVDGEPPPPYEPSTVMQTTAVTTTTNTIPFFDVNSVGVYIHAYIHTYIYMLTYAYICT